jgi:hypothetical protein
LNSIARMQGHERAELFGETAARKGIADAIVEKDFWVCWMLQQLFSIDTLKGRLLFKGGTSLSKVFHAINRFSEDIDLAVDYVALGFTGERDPRQDGISTSKRNKILAEMMNACQLYIGTEFIQAVDKRCREILGAPDAWSLGVSETDPNVVRFRYPGSGGKTLVYVPPQVVLELGTHAEFVPHDRFSIRSFAAEEFPDVVTDGDVDVVALLAKRTFWEKATILHQEYHRAPEKLLPERYSRHYYDLSMLAQSQIRAEALGDFTLLADVVKHKETFYPSAWAQYELARPGTLRLVPKAEWMAALERDYKNMGIMIFAEPPPFAGIIETLGRLEEDINRQRT